jgi:hypothetical protein
VKRSNASLDELVRVHSNLPVEGWVVHCGPSPRNGIAMLPKPRPTGRESEGSSMIFKP